MVPCVELASHPGYVPGIGLGCIPTRIKQFLKKN